MAEDNEADLDAPATLSWLTTPPRSANGYERNRYQLFPTLRDAVKAWGELEEQRVSASILTDGGEVLGADAIERLFRRIHPAR